MQVGYGVQLMRVPKIIRLSGGKKGLNANYLVNGTSHPVLSDLLNIPNLDKKSVFAKEILYLSDSMNIYPLNLLYKRDVIVT